MIKNLNIHIVRGDQLAESPEHRVYTFQNTKMNVYKVPWELESQSGTLLPFQVLCSNKCVMGIILVVHQIQRGGQRAGEGKTS